MRSVQEVLGTLNSSPVVTHVRELSGGVPAQSYMVSGALRDLFLGRKPRSYQFVVQGDPSEFASKLAARTAGHASRRETRRGMVARYFGELGELYFLPAEGLGINDYMARHADFTVNSLAFGVEGGELLEFHSAFEDLSGKRVRLVSPMASAPNAADLLLRSISLLLSEPEFVMDDQTSAAIRSHSSRVVEADPYEVDQEMSKILSSEDYLKGLRMLNELALLPGVFSSFLPCAAPLGETAEGEGWGPYPIEEVVRLGKTVDELLPPDHAFLQNNVHLLRCAVLLTPWIRQSLPFLPASEIRPRLIRKGAQIESDLLRLTAHIRDPLAYAFRVRVVTVGYLAGVAPLCDEPFEAGRLERALGQTVATFGAWKGLLAAVLICADCVARAGGEGFKAEHRETARELLRGLAGRSAGRDGAAPGN